jgi:3D (Asp-Asp-Asp) domain-containing protein
VQKSKAIFTQAIQTLITGLLLLSGPAAQSETSACSSGIQGARITHYYIPRVSDERDRRCRMEGTCVYELDGQEMIWNYGTRPEPRVTAQCPFGYGARSNCLEPCHSLAADLRYHKIGARIFIPDLVGKRCGDRVLDGIFTVADKGQAILGRNRFDFFLGDCNHTRDHVCHDPRLAEVTRALMKSYIPWCPAKTE